MFSLHGTAITLPTLGGRRQAKALRQATSSNMRATGDQEGDGWHTSLSDSKNKRQ